MLIERLQDTSALTTNEKQLADFILTHTDTVTGMTIHELAQAAFVSPPTVTRLCKKLDLKGFNQFKVQLSAECTERYQALKAVDSNYPFQESDTPREIVDHLANLSIQHILAAKDNMDFRMLDKVVRSIRQLRIIDIYGAGTSLSSAYNFAEKMIRIGYRVTIEADSSRQRIQATVSSKKCFSIVVSYSGMTAEILGNIRKLHEKKSPILLITANRVSPMIQYATYVYYIYSEEKLEMKDKLDNFGSLMVEHFLFDCIYALLFASDYRAHQQISNEINLAQHLLEPLD